MEIKVGFEITYAATQATPMVIMLSIHPSRTSDIIGTESILAEPSAKSRFGELGAMRMSGSPADFGKLIADETKKWAEVVKFSGAKVD